MGVDRAMPAPGCVTPSPTVPMVGRICAMLSSISGIGRSRSSSAPTRPGLRGSAALPGCQAHLRMVGAMPQTGQGLGKIYRIKRGLDPYRPHPPHISPPCKILFSLNDFRARLLAPKRSNQSTPENKSGLGMDREPRGARPLVTTPSCLCGFDNETQLNTFNNTLLPLPPVIRTMVFDGTSGSRCSQYSLVLPSLCSLKACSCSWCVNRYEAMWRMPRERDPVQTRHHGSESLTLDPTKPH